MLEMLMDERLRHIEREYERQGLRVKVISHDDWAEIVHWMFYELQRLKGIQHFLQSGGRSVPPDHYKRARSLILALEKMDWEHAPVRTLTSFEDRPELIKWARGLP
jgi:hypothetical protein